MKKLFKRISLVILLLIIGFVSFLLYETKDEINADLSNIEEKLTSFYNENRMAGFAVSVFNTDSVIYSNGFGFSDIQNKKPYTKNTQQYIASVSKTTIGIALMKGVEVGLFKLEDAINQHLPFEVNNSNFPNEKITIEHLATHTSSLDYNEKVVESLYVEDAQKVASLDSFMRAYFQNKDYGKVTFTNDAPGRNWNYSNIGAGLAAYIIELKSGMTYADFTQQYIFNPLELQSTFWFESKADSLLQTKYYEPEGEAIKEAQTSGVKLYPCRDLITDIRDLTKYCQAIISHDSKLLSEASFQKLLDSALDNSVANQEEDNHGMFFTIDRNNYGITYQLTGGSGGDNCINTMMYFDPKTELGYIFIGNTGHGKINSSNHIWIYRALVSLGDHVKMDASNNSFSQRIKHKWHNYYNRVSAIF